MTRRPPLLACALAGAFLLPLKAFAVPITHDFTWSGVNDYFLTGTLQGMDSNADGQIRNRDGEVVSLSFEAFFEGTSIGLGYADPFAASADPFFNLNFDIATGAFTQGEGLGPRGQQWNVKGPGIGLSQGGNGALLRRDGKNDFSSFTIYRNVPGSGFATSPVVVEVPEPTSLALLVAGFAGFVGARRRSFGTR